MSQEQHPRIRPSDIVASSDDPFENDLLERRPAVESSTPILASLTGPCVISVDAEYGAGRTLFLRMWSQHLQNAGFHVIQLNAWEADFTNKPLHALTAELTRSSRRPLGAEGETVGKMRRLSSDAGKSKFPVFRPLTIV